MKKLVLLSAAVLPFLSYAQKPFHIKGNAGALKSGTTVYLSYAADRKNILDSSEVSNGLFAFSGEVTDPTKASLYIKPEKTPGRRDGLAFYLEPANISISLKDSLKTASISGSEINADDAALKKATQKVQDELAVLSGEYSKFTDEQKKDEKFLNAFYEKQKTAYEKIYAIQLAFTKANPNSYISLTTLTPLAAKDTYLDEAQQAFDGLATELKASKAGKNAVQVFAAAHKTKIGQPAIAFTQNDVNGKPISLESFKGKYVLIDFWASWCGPCRRENPHVVSAYNQFKDKGFTILGVSLDKPDAHADWVKAIADDQLDWPQVSDLKFWDNEVAKAYGVRSIPANFLIDPNGKIIAKGLRGEALTKKLAEVLDPKALAKSK